MAFSQQRLAKALAATRIVVGILFLVLGQSKVASIDYARGPFQQQLVASLEGEAVGFYRSFLVTFVEPNPGRVAVMLGFGELFIGVGLVLGLAVRPISVLGMFYMLNLVLASWRHGGSELSFLRHFANEGPQVCVFLLFLLMGLGHAGETWGLGALYHQHAEKGRLRDQRYRRYHWGEEDGAAASIVQDIEPPPACEEDWHDRDLAGEEPAAAAEPKPEEVSQAGEP